MIHQPYHLLIKLLDVIALTKAERLIDIESTDPFIAKAVTHYLAKPVQTVSLKQALSKTLQQADCVLLIDTLDQLGKREGKSLLKQLLKQHHAILIGIKKGVWDASDIAALANAFILYDADRQLIYATHSEKAIMDLRKARIKHKILRTVERSSTVKKIIKRVLRKKKPS